MKIKMEMIYKAPTGTETCFYSDEMNPEKALLLAKDLEKTGRVKELIFYDNYDTTWMYKELKKYVESVDSEPHNVVVFFDGGFDLETKRSGLGCVIYYEQDGKQYRIRKNALVEELNTNGEAEYASLYFAIGELELLGVHHLPVTFTGDSQGVMNQLKDEWPCYEEELLRWIERIEKKLEQLGITPDYKLVPRKKNREADHLATQAINGIEIASNSELT
ncbi:reverse transcriptase-like protein [Ornithinibacillus sp. BX22]|uniref:Reverse transcriptase-like protein n=1 Tax=Ornithinibacillus hominis TaxID=2763055 RepID=A0A923L6A2_9BACI|nr:ribonuclease H family protein [Ornithinibacillus hominis]MBC5637290.1 reverse transcriptase-like protein [Ornithinibacillus hominis]